MRLYVKKLNEVFMRIETDDSGIKFELKEHFSFFAPNYKWHPSFKRKLWDGKISLYDLRTSSLHVGLIWDLFLFCEQRGYSLKLLDNPEYTSLKNHTITPSKLTDEDAKILDAIPFKYGDPRDYQLQAISHCIENKRAIVKSPTGCIDGDTLLECLIIEEA